MAKADMSDFEEFEHSAGALTRRVFTRGPLDAPPVLLMHELPGMVPDCIDLARRLVDEGFRVYMPLLMGEPGDNRPVAFTLVACIRREFTLFARRGNGELVSWLRSLCQRAAAECGDAKVGVIGMCLTGGFALALLADDTVYAPVASQPSLPVGFSAAKKRSFGFDDALIERAAERSEALDIDVMAMRFTGDRLCPKERFDEIERVFGDRFRRIEIPSGRGAANGHGPVSHSVLTLDFREGENEPTFRAWREVVDFLHAGIDRVTT